MPVPAVKANPNWPAAKKGPKGLKRSDVKEGDEKEVDGEEKLEKGGGGEEDGGGGGEGDKVAKVEKKMEVEKVEWVGLSLEAKLAELKAKKQEMEAEEAELEAAIENQKIQETFEFLEKQCGEDLQWQQMEQQEAQQKQWQQDLQEAKRRRKERVSVEEVKEEIEADRAEWQKVLQSYKEAHKTKQESHQKAQLEQLKLAAAAASGKVQKAEGSKCKDDDSGASGDTE